MNNAVVLRALSAAFVVALLLAGPASAQTLRASHQFPGGKGDVRDDMVQMIAKEVKAANVGLDVQVYPGAALFKPNDQWDALVKGQLDISLFPLDYASGKVPAFSGTLMPGLVQSNERAKRINASAFMTDMHKIIGDAGVIVLSDAWFAGGMSAKTGCILEPANIKGLKYRAAGPTFAAMWEAAGANIVTPPSNELYNAFQTGVVQGTDTSLGTFVSTRLYEQVKCLTAPGDHALWMMYEPALISKRNFEKLTKEQQAALIKAGKNAQAYYEAKAPALDEEAVKVFKDNHVEVVTLSEAQFKTWLDLAKKTSYEQYAKDVPEGKKLLDEALAVQ
jgi:TRAP-type transport system periplasmic protein